MANEKIYGMLFAKVFPMLIFSNAPALNPNRKIIKGVICGIRMQAFLT